MPLPQPPLYEKLADSALKATPAWAIFFDGLSSGDAGLSWTPAFTNLTTVGTPVITGRYFVISNYITVFWVKIVPATSVSATQGTTYINNYPLNFTQDGVVFTMSGNLSINPGQIVASNNRIYIDDLSAVTTDVTFLGIGFING